MVVVAGRQPLGVAPRLSALLQQACDGVLTADRLHQQLEARAAALGLLAKGQEQEQEEGAWRVSRHCRRIWGAGEDCWAQAAGAARR